MEQLDLFSDAIKPPVSQQKQPSQTTLGKTQAKSKVAPKKRSGVKKRGKRLPYTPNSKIRQALRQLFLRSRERAATLKKSGYCCEKCGIKQSKAKGKEVKVNVHHKSGIDWDGVFDYIRQFLLNAEDMECLCEGCHEDEHKED